MLTLVSPVGDYLELGQLTCSASAVVPVAVGHVGQSWAANSEASSATLIFLWLSYTGSSIWRTAATGIFCWAIFLPPFASLTSKSNKNGVCFGGVSKQELTLSFLS